MSAHDPGGGSKTLRHVFETAAREGMIDLCARAALLAENTAFWSGLPIPHVIPMLEQTLTRMGEEPSPLRARLLASLARALLYDKQLKEADRFSREAVEDAREAADPGTLSFALSRRLIVIWGPSTSDERLACANEMLEMANLVGDPQQACASHGYLVTIHLERGEKEPYTRHIQDCVHLDADSRLPFLGWANRVFLTGLPLLEGRYDEALERAQKAFELGRRTSIDAVDGTYSLQMFTITRDRGQVATLRPVLERFLKESSAPTWKPGLALLYAELGIAAEARAVFEQVASERVRGDPSRCRLAWGHGVPRRGLRFPPRRGPCCPNPRDAPALGALRHHPRRHRGLSGLWFAVPRSDVIAAEKVGRGGGPFRGSPRLQREAGRAAGSGQNAARLRRHAVAAAARR